jgi:hypothetical protein
MERKNWEEGGQVRTAPLSGASLVALREGEKQGGPRTCEVAPIL